MDTKPVPAEMPEPEQQPSMYERLGGAAVIATAVNLLYEEILADEELAAYFRDTEMPKLKRHMALLLTSLLGGPNTYDGRSLAEAHAHLNVTSEHYDRVCSILRNLLLRLDAPSDIIDAVVTVAVASKPQIVRGWTPTEPA